MVARTRKSASSAAEKSSESELRITYEPLAALLQREAPRNAKQHDIDGVSASMTRFGYTGPITIDEGTGLIVAGHGRVETLALRKSNGTAPPERVRVDQKSGDWLIPVLRGIRFRSPEEAEAYLLADNRLVEVGGYDDALLADMLEEVRERGDGLEGLGWSDQQATDMIASIRDATAGAGDAGPDPASRFPPEDFASHDANTKETVHCPRCGFPIVSE